MGEKAFAGDFSVRALSGDYSPSPSEPRRKETEQPGGQHVRVVQAGAVPQQMPSQAVTGA